LLSAWLGLPAWGIHLTLSILYLTTAGVIHWVSFRAIKRQNVLSFAGLVPPFFVAPGIIFALITAFLANDVWARERQASVLLLDERDGVRAVFALRAGAVHLDRSRPQILALLIFTASAVVALGLIAVCEQPFQGSHQKSPAPLQELLSSMRSG
jgi:hypothetical protein